MPWNQEERQNTEDFRLSEDVFEMNPTNHSSKAVASLTRKRKLSLVFFAFHLFSGPTWQQSIYSLLFEVCFTRIGLFMGGLGEFLAELNQSLPTGKKKDCHGSLGKTFLGSCHCPLPLGLRGGRTGLTGEKGFGKVTIC